MSFLIFRSSEETLITKWLFFRYMMVGIYVGVATVGGASYWFLYDPTGPQMSYYQLSNFLQCPAEPEKFKGLSCDIFSVNNFIEPLMFCFSFGVFYIGRTAFSYLIHLRGKDMCSLVKKIFIPV